MHSGLDAIIFGGPNGAGKTTLARQILPSLFPSLVFLNADEISRQSSSSSPISAGRKMLQRLDELVEQRHSFAIETTLSSKMYLSKIDIWKQRGYRTLLHFIQLPSEDYAVVRVQRRVAAGGHSIPEEDIRRRFRRGIRLFHGAYKETVDDWYHWRSDEGGLHFVDKAP